VIPDDVCCGQDKHTLDMLESIHLQHKLQVRDSGLELKSKTKNLKKWS
jgi:hypothetical protein